MGCGASKKVSQVSAPLAPAPTKSAMKQPQVATADASPAASEAPPPKQVAVAAAAPDGDNDEQSPKADPPAATNPGDAEATDKVADPVQEAKEAPAEQAEKASASPGPQCPPEATTGEEPSLTSSGKALPRKLPELKVGRKLYFDTPEAFLEQKNSPKYGLVIGNGEYSAAEQWGALPKAAGDAEAFAAVLGSCGYAVRKVSNASHAVFKEHLDTLCADLKPKASVIFFFAGHGAQKEGQNYLVDADADANDVSACFSPAVVMQRLWEAGAGVVVALVDACTKDGLADVGVASPSPDKLGAILYAAAPGCAAVQGEGERGPFADALVQFFPSAPDLESLARRVSRSVHETTSGQAPYFASNVNIRCAL